MHAYTSPADQAVHIASLEASVAELQTQLGEGVDAEKIVARHIRLLHTYNEAKDAAQVLIGRLAALRGTTVRGVHEELGLGLGDD
ncbi:hypothetical protein FIBSPDRAFT_1051509 [Athelia psychrophila]|uniref:Swi5-domain-containing protein n=1 Tax=Athelia psychrophila TaxID=1759441 RepID=A0A165Z0N4_9AGAM|nr:hypothetical protein FIBSPDRAFT_1051509 [Fibularhizoctonia sp. CBS 109695]